MNILDQIEKKKVLILGFGREGQSTYRFIRNRFPRKQIGIADKKKLGEVEGEIRNVIKSDKNINLFFGENYLKMLEDFEVVIKSPGIPNLKEIKSAKSKGVEFTSQTKIFFDLCSGKIIGVTGTKGKSTTTSLIDHILKTAGIPSVLLGNIGKPSLDYLGENDKTYYVFELSSHQLSDMEKSPHIAIFLNIYPEHLDYYGNFKEYLDAKGRITKYQKSSDYLVYNADFPEVEQIASMSAAKKFKLSMKGRVDKGCYLQGRDIHFVDNGVEKYRLDVGKVTLSGIHNIYNVMSAIIVAMLAGVKDKIIDAAVAKFVPLEGRLEVVGVIGSVTFINDTLATIPEATIAAVETFRDKKMTLILGGFDRGISFDKLGKNLSESVNITNVILIGQTAGKIKHSLTRHQFHGKVYELGTATMKEIVELSARITPKEGAVLLSPASTSFDMFKDYKDRGNQFRKEVLKLKN